MDDLGQIPSDITQEGAKIGKKVVQGLAETAGSLASQLVGGKPKDPQELVEELRRKDEEFKKKVIPEIRARLQRMKEEEARLHQRREQEKKDWSLIQKEKLAPPQIARSQQPSVLPQVAKQRPETKVGWGAG